MHSLEPQHNNKKRRIVSEINVTPFVDVLLVLLVIFMVTAPMMTSSINVALPQGTDNQLVEDIAPIVVSIKQDGVIFLEEKETKLAFLAKDLLQLTNNNLENKIHIRADKDLDYGRVMEVVKTISLAGFDKVILVTELAQ
jgi:biopolymer transport protein TolR